MTTDFKFITECLQEFESRLRAELPNIITAISTTEIPLIDVKNIHVGYFDPVSFSNTPAIFIVPDTNRPEYDDQSYSSYQTDLSLSLYLVTAQDSNDRKLASYQLYNYVKAIIIFINQHLDDYALGEEGCQVYEMLGADTGKRWAEIAINIISEVRY